MIQCPKCGAANRRGSRFCNECGEPLPIRTALRCPMCGTMNPVGNVYCDKCHARLIPMAASPPQEAESAPEPAAPIKGLSLPTIPLETPMEPPAEEIPESAEVEALPDWLTSLRDAAPTEEVAPQEGEDWLTQLRGADVVEEAGAEIAAEVEAEATPDWLADLRGPAPVEEAAPEESADWLAQFRGADVVEGAEEEEITAGVEAEGTPDWLADLRGPAPVEETGDWLTQLRGAEIPEPEEPAAMVEPVEPVEIPDWLQDMGAMGTEEGPVAREEPSIEQVPPVLPPVTEPMPEEATAAAPEAPDWLQEITPEAAPPAVEAMPEEVTPASVEVPDWLRDIEEPAPVGELMPEEVTPAPVEVPDWLQDIEEPAPAAMEPVLEEVAPSLAEMPDWLQDIAPEAEAPAAEAMPEEAVPGLAEMPDWLREIEEETAVPAAPPSAPPVVEAAAPAVPETPDWLRDIAAEEETPEAVPTIPPPAEEGLEWLAELEAEAGPPSATPAVPAFEPPPAPVGAEGLAPAELPAWMEALRPRGPEAEMAAEGPVETVGLLKGLRGVLAPAFSIEVPAAPVSKDAVPAEAREASLSRAQLLQSLLVQPTEAPEPEARERRPRVGERVERWLVTVGLLIVAAMLIATQIPQIEQLGLGLTGLAQPAKYTAGSARRDLQRLGGMYNAIQGLNAGAGDTVLIAFEYGPAEADELDLVADPIVRHLLDQGVHLIPVSTRPEGKPTAERLLTEIVASGPYTITQYREVLSYRPGDAMGAAQLLAATDTTPSLVLVLTAQPSPLRWWVEQIGARGRNAPPIVAGVSAALEAAASPYLDARAQQLTGAISGLSGAAAYEQVRGVSGKATQRLDALLVGHMTIVGLIVIGVIIHGPSALRRRKK